MYEWTLEHFPDLSAVWLEADLGNYFLCVQYEGFAKYSAWVAAPDDTDVSCICSSIEEAKQVAEDMYHQILLDICGDLFLGS